MNNNFKLKDLLSELGKGNIELPNIQRGFVWKPYQIENLWDSVMRGYPIGAFTIQEKNNKKYILDGQQRMSALAIGYNLIESLNVEKNEYKLFIDLYKPTVNNENDDNLAHEDFSPEKTFYVRVITKYHPWGYRFKESEKTLEAHHIDSALHFYGDLNKSKENKNSRFIGTIQESHYPFDSYFPVPLACFIDVNENKISIKNDSKALESIKKWILSLDKNSQKHFSSILCEITKHHSQLFENEILAKSLIETSLAEYKKEKLKEIPTLQLRNYFIKNIDKEKNRLPPLSFYSVSEICNTLNSSLSGNLAFIEINSLLEEHSIHNNVDIEHIFERLNRGGTPISLEELNYSLFKAKFSSEANENSPIKQFEDWCKEISISPARLLPVMFRLYQHAEKISSATRLRIKGKDFKREVLSNEGFFMFLQKNTKNLLHNYKTLMLYQEKTNECGLPYPLLIKLINEAPELLFMALYRIKIKKDNIKQKNFPEKLIYLTLTLYWFFGGYPKKKYPQLLSSIFSAIAYLPAERFYSYEILHKALTNLDGQSTPVINLEEFKDTPSEKLRFYSGVQRIIENRDFLLYAQRKILTEWFKNEYFDAKDTNRPFDYDHIMPHSWIKGKRNIHSTLKDIYNSNGNLRAWPYMDNRRDQDTIPFEKISTPEQRENSFALKDWNFDAITLDKCKKGAKGVHYLIKLISNRNSEIYNSYYLPASKYIELKKQTTDERSLLNALKYIEESTSKNGYARFCSNKNFILLDNIQLIFEVARTPRNGIGRPLPTFTLEGDFTNETNSALTDGFNLYILKERLQTRNHFDKKFIDTGDYLYANIVMISFTQKGISDFVKNIINLLKGIKLISNTNLSEEFTRCIKVVYLNSEHSS